jgi:hypothetical protein
MSENKRLSPKQETAINALLTEPTTRAAAAAAKVSEATIWRWLADPDFAAAYREARGQLLESTLTAMQAAGGDAVKCLRDVMKDEQAQPSARVAAAKAILDLGLKAREVLDNEERLQAVEQFLKLLKVG